MPHNQVKYLSREVIEQQAERLLRDASSQDLTVSPPVPVEDILERVTGLALTFDDLGSQDYLGCVDIDARLVTINKYLLPELAPGLEGRFRFTVAHEIGHWVLHRDLLDPARQGMQHLEQEPARGHVSQSLNGAAKPRLEWQADQFASCLLMPRQAVHQAWTGEFGPSAAPLPFPSVDTTALQPLPSSYMRLRLAMERANEDYEAEKIVGPLAAEFRVSPQAMRIRCEELRLFVRKNQQVPSGLA